uniref:Uncharacterized protein n=1 Tax=Lepeophtheirus salmonis TaxID=72036 RepID=A0A0K2SYC1_LEPSM
MPNSGDTVFQYCIKSISFCFSFLTIKNTHPVA